MAISKGSLVTASDMSGVLTASNFFDTIDLNALKEALNVANTSGAKIVGAGNGSFDNSSGSLTITLSTSNYDYLVISSVLSGTAQYDTDYTALSKPDYNIFEPLETIIPKGVASGTFPLKHYYSYTYDGNGYNAVRVSSVSYTLSGATLTISVPYASNSGTSLSSNHYAGIINVVCYKN